MKVNLGQLNTSLGNTVGKQGYFGVSAPQNQPSFKGIPYSKLSKIRELNIDSDLVGVFKGRFVSMLKEFSDAAGKLKLTRKIDYDPKIISSIVDGTAQQGTIKITERSLGGKFIDNITYFTKNLWLDIANAFLGTLKKTKIGENKFLNKFYDSGLLQNRRLEKEANDLFYGIVGMASNCGLNSSGKVAEKTIASVAQQAEKTAASVAQQAEKIAEKAGQKTKNPTDWANIINSSLKKATGNYDTKNERALNRLATGMISATFVGKDFYNLSMYQNDDPKQAKKTERKRFMQETRRILSSAFLSFSILGIFSKYTNKSLPAAVAAMVGATAFSEIFSRLRSNTPLIPLTSKQAKEIHDKRKAKSIQKNATAATLPQNDTSTVQANSSPIFSIGNTKISNVGEFAEFARGKDSQKMATDKINFMANDNRTNPKNAKRKKPHILLKALGVFFGLAGAGFAISKGKQKFGAQITEFADKNKIAQALKKVRIASTKRTKYIQIDELESFFSKLETSGYTELVTKYRKLFEEVNGEGSSVIKKVLINKNGVDIPYYDLGKVDAWWGCWQKIPNTLHEALKYPYKFVSRIAEKMGFKTASATKKATPNELEIARNALINLYSGLGVKKGTSQQEFNKLINAKINDIFNEETSVKYQQADFVMISRTFVTLIASYFFVNDFRNQVLIESAGKDTQRADEVTKERIGHKITNFFTNAFWMTLFNSAFQKPFLGSLAGATAVAAATELTNETSIRYSIGVPVTRKGSKKEIEDFERKNFENDGPYGKWIRLVSKATGKKCIGEKAKAEEQKKAKKLTKAS